MLRDVIKRHLIYQRDQQYEKELAEKSAAYARWFELHREELREELAHQDHTEGGKLSAEVVRYSHLRNYIVSGEQHPDIIIACDDDGSLTDYAVTMICDFFAANPDIGMLYGDEDRVGENGILCDPWFKSDWAPDTFLSTFYFGNVFAFRSSELAMINPARRRASDYEARSRLEDDSEEEAKARNDKLDDSMRCWIYGKLCLKLAQAENGFTRRMTDHFPIGHISEILFHSNSPHDPWDSDLIHDSLTGRFSDASASTRMVSIIIPSKDNPEVLARCIHSIEKYTESSPYEIIVVDNGSSSENIRRVQAILDEHNENGSAQYIYQEMPFNFSRMCNLGAQHALGELLLFLNDDIEIAKPNWLSYLSEKAKLPYVGAVGMKLLYPNSDIIQHAGVVNVHVGPIHALQYCSNKEEYYFGFNKGVRNVIAVTGACLMVRTDLFHEIGGFDEENFAVAFNDIDLCLKIFERGYYNVVRNNMYLYHHESLSRGDDRKDKVKQQRLSGEQQRLLKAHPALFSYDPYYHKYLTQDPAVTDFRVDLEAAKLRHVEYETPVLVTKPFPASWEDPVLRLGVEFANDISTWLDGPFAAGEVTGYFIKGYSFVIDADNAVYNRKILLKSEKTGQIWKLHVENSYRPDIADHLTDQKNDKLTGFGTAIAKDALPTGSYLVGMLAIDKTSRQRLFVWSDVKLVIK